MPLSFNSVIKVVQCDGTIVERAMNFDGTFYDVDPQTFDASEGSIDFLHDEDGFSFMDAMDPKTDVDDVADDYFDGSYG